MEFTFITMTVGGSYGSSYTGTGENWWDAADEAEAAAKKAGEKVLDVMDTHDVEHPYILVVEG